MLLGTPGSQLFMWLRAKEARVAQRRDVEVFFQPFFVTRLFWFSFDFSQRAGRTGEVSPRHWGSFRPFLWAPSGIQATVRFLNL